MNEPEDAAPDAPIDPVAAAAAIDQPQPTPMRPTGAGVMGPRAGDHDELLHRAAVDEAKHAARTSGHRFDLMRYMRLRRTREPT